MRKVAIAATLAMLASLLMIVPALASHDEVSLTGSEFEIDTDANLKVDDPAPPSLDWANVDEARQPDEPTGANDDSFGEGTKEDTPVPTIVDGSIPNNKSDLLNFGVYLEEAAAGDFLNVFWQRVQEPTGTTNMDFEFNQSEMLSSNGVTPVRTAGDVLIQYDLASGGTNVQLFLSLWVTSGPNSQCEANGAKVPCWGDRENLTTAGEGTGSINTSAIPVAESDGLATVNPISPRTFGEAQIDFDAFTSGGGGTDPCVSFGSAYLKSRASDSFTAALKDFIAPVGLDISNCGSIEVTKVDDGNPATTLEGATFVLRPDVAPLGGSPGAEDMTTDSCTTDATGVCSFTDLLQGDYWVEETVAPAGHDLADPAFQLVTVTADETIEIMFVNPRQLGAIQLTKTAKHAAADGGVIPHVGVDFTIAGTAVTTGADGTACVGGLALGQSYDVVETVPAGYNAEGLTTKSVLVDSAGTCDAGFETVEFVNVPLTDITFSVNSQIPGGTASEITCDDPNNPPDNESTATTDADGNGSLTVDDLEPGTYTCTVVIDP
jgi:Prealbumin-like fold domain